MLTLLTTSLMLQAIILFLKTIYQMRNQPSVSVVLQKQHVPSGELGVVGGVIVRVTVTSLILEGVKLLIQVSDH